MSRRGGCMNSPSRAWLKRDSFSHMGASVMVAWVVQATLSGAWFGRRMVRCIMVTLPDRCFFLFPEPLDSSCRVSLFLAEFEVIEFR